MKHADFVNKVIEKGIAAARLSYTRPDQQQKLAGAIAGFESCYSKNADYLAQLLKVAVEKKKSYLDKADYWFYACFAAEVEWVCNCVSAALVHQGKEPIIPPTVRAVQNAEAILKEE